MPNELYTGFEIGPIRPPDEVDSLLFRFSRNCPWNKCTFCPLYKNDKFSIGPLNELVIEKHLRGGSVIGVYPVFQSLMKKR